MAISRDQNWPSASQDEAGDEEQADDQHFQTDRAGDADAASDGVVNDQQEERRRAQRQQHEGDDGERDPHDQVEQPQPERSVAPAQAEPFAPGRRRTGGLDLIHAAVERGARYIAQDRQRDDQDQHEAAAQRTEGEYQARVEVLQAGHGRDSEAAASPARAAAPAGAAAAAGQRQQDAEDPEDFVAPGDLPGALDQVSVVHDWISLSLAWCVFRIP